AIENAAEALIVFFHRLRLFIVKRRWKIFENGRDRRKRDWCETDDRIFCRWFGNSFTGIQVAREQLARFEKLVSGPTGFADGRVVVVARCVRLEWAIAARPQAKRRAAVRHIDAE